MRNRLPGWFPASPGHRLGALQRRWRRHRRMALHRPRHFLAIYAIMQNEAHILREWVDLHPCEGFEHFFLLDHGSTDNWREVLAPDIAVGRVTVRELGHAPGSLDWLRAVHADFALDAAEWVCLQDLDEFTHAAGPVPIRDFLASLDDMVAQVAVPWVAFGTNGHIAQPRLVVPACIIAEDMAQRAHLPDVERPWHAKGIVRARRLHRFESHLHRVRGRTVLPLPERPEVSHAFYVPNRFAARLDEFAILQNHYVHQSLDFYRRKMQRRGYWLEQNAGRKSYTEERFNREEALLNAVRDHRLLDRHRSYYVSHEADRATAP